MNCNDCDVKLTTSREIGRKYCDECWNKKPLIPYHWIVIGIVILVIIIK